MSGEPADPSAALLLWTIAGFAAVSWLLWRCLLNPSAPAPSSPPAAAARTTAAAATSGGAARTRGGGAAARAAAPKKGPGDGGGAFSFGRPRRPPHLVPPVGWEERGGGRGATDLSMCVVQGVVPFRNTPAAGYEAGLKREAEAKAAEASATDADGDGDAPPPPPDPIVVHRRERARIFARMFSTASGGGRPPNRGANVVAAIRHAELSCPKLQKALFLLGTYYNLFVLVDSAGASALAAGGEGEMREFVRRMRSELLNRGSDGSDAKGYRLNAAVLPPHRIAFSSTPKGRVAFVRQLHGTELVLDFDGDVTKELERFGFRVLAYPKKNGSSSSSSSSSLGDFLIPGPFCSG